MSLSNKGAPAYNNNKLSASSIGKAKGLNPNAAEFVPFALRSPSGPAIASDTSSSVGTYGPAATTGKVILGRSESSISNNSDDEAQRYWRNQLPDDITPDFNVTADDKTQGMNALPFSSLSLSNSNDTSSFTALTGSGFGLPSFRVNASSFNDKMSYSVSSFVQNPSLPGIQLDSKPWEKQNVVGDQLFTGGAREGLTANDVSGHLYLNDMLNDQRTLEGNEVMNPLEFLASQFPGFAAESLSEIFFTNGGDLNLTVEMLTELELQVDGGLNQNLNSKALSAPNLRTMDFPALSVADDQNGAPKFSGDYLQQNVNPNISPDKSSLLLFKSSSSAPSIGTTDFASAVRKMASQDSSIWKYDRNGASVGSNRSSNVLATTSYNVTQATGVSGDRLNSQSSSRAAAPVWLETGEAVANMYSEMRGEARDHARLRNAYFEQARQAYLIGNKALSKELSVKGQLHNIHMKAAHGKAQESIYRHGNPVSPTWLAREHGNGRGERIIDLHGLHVSEAIHVLKRDLAMLRNAARSAGHRQVSVYICVGTGHHTRGSRTPARLPIAVQRYLLEEEGLDYSEPQPGLLRVAI